MMFVSAALWSINKNFSKSSSEVEKRLIALLFLSVPGEKIVRQCVGDSKYGLKALHKINFHLLKSNVIRSSFKFAVFLWKLFYAEIIA